MGTSASTSPTISRASRHGVERLSQTFIFEVWIYLLLLCGALAYSASAKGRPETRLLLAGLGASGILYVVPYFFLAVSVDYRYSHWVVICGSVCAVVLARSLFAALRERRRGRLARATAVSGRPLTGSGFAPSLRCTAILRMRHKDHSFSELGWKEPRGAGCTGENGDQDGGATRERATTK